MFDNEEKQLREIRSELENISIPQNELDQAIKRGLRQADSALKDKASETSSITWWHSDCSYLVSYDCYLY